MTLSLRNMRGWGCASPASTAICPGATINATQRYARLPNTKTPSPASEFDEKLLKPDPSSQQVVVLRVSLHCRGCEAKLRKHLSKMQGVTSFGIDMETKKVTVIGNVTPSDVLASISKVKNAQFWPSPSTSPASSSFPSSTS